MLVPCRLTQAHIRFIPIATTGTTRQRQLQTTHTSCSRFASASSSLLSSSFPINLRTNLCGLSTTIIYTRPTFHTNDSSTMKVRYVIGTACCMANPAWSFSLFTPTAPPSLLLPIEHCSNVGRAGFTTTPFSPARRTYSTSQLRQSAVFDDEVIQEPVSAAAAADTTTTVPTKTISSTSSSSSLPGQPIAKGSVVTVFRGGLVAVRINDDLSKMMSNEGIVVNPQVEGTEIPAATLKASLPPLSSPMPNSSGISKTNQNSLGGDLIGRQVVFGQDGDNGPSGVVVVHRPPMVFVYTRDDNDDDDDNTVATLEGSVTVLDNLYTINVPETVHRVDGFGRYTTTTSNTATIDDASPQRLSRPMFAPIPQVKDISLINKPLVTGVTMFDALAPIGKGQNMLMIGHDMEDMRRYVIGDFFKIQQAAGTKCVYASTGDEQDQASVTSLLELSGLTEEVTLVTTSPNKKKSNQDEADQASRDAEGTVVAATACAIGESFALQEGLDTLVVIDNIDRHKKLWDVTTRVLVDVFGVDSVVKGDRDGGASSEMRAFFSSLVQRSAQFKVKRGGGSVTLVLLQSIPQVNGDGDDESTVFTMEDFEGAPHKVRERLDLLAKKNIPLTAANLRKIQIPVPSADEGKRRLVLQHVDELISMSDGQIWLDDRLEQSGRRPAMDFQRSITRIGIGHDTESRADAAAMRRVVEGLRLDLSQAESMDGADVETTASKKQMKNAAAWLLAMHQPSATGARTLSESCVALLAASIGALDDSIGKGMETGSEEGVQLMRHLLDHVKGAVPAAMQEIDSSQDFSEETKEIISKAIQSFFDSSR